MQHPAGSSTSLRFAGGQVEYKTVGAQRVDADAHQRGRGFVRMVQGDDAARTHGPEGNFLDRDGGRVIDSLPGQFPNQGGRRVPLAVAETSDQG